MAGCIDLKTSLITSPRCCTDSLFSLSFSAQLSGCFSSDSCSERGNAPQRVNLKRGAENGRTNSFVRFPTAADPLPPFLPTALWEMASIEDNWPQMDTSITCQRPAAAAATEQPSLPSSVPHPRRIKSGGRILESATNDCDCDT